MSARSTLSPHPRLLIGPAELKRLNQPTRHPMLRKAIDGVIEAADRYLAEPLSQWDLTRHNAALIVARTTQARILTLLVRWKMTGDDRYRRRVLEHVATMGKWRYWSWIAWRRGDDAPDTIFDLSYGENSATLALAFDLLADTLDDRERALFVDQARSRALAAFLRHTDPKSPAWWVGKPDTNWNTVCAGGAGMLALAMHEHMKEADLAIARAEESIKPFMESLKQTDGGWPEGIGYWNYGMRYAFLYLLSHERATGRKHPLLEQKATARTMEFPVDFTPHGVACSFGDVNRMQPSPVHYATLQRLGRGDLVGQYDARLDLVSAPVTERWPELAEMVLFHPRKVQRPKTQRNRVRLWRGLDWATLSDRWPDPDFYLSVRGGTTEVPHGHHDLLSFHAVVGGERLIENIGPGEYIDSTFGPQRYELPEFRADGKNTLLINGVGIHAPCEVKTTKVSVGRCPGIRIDATGAFGSHRDVPVARFAGRLFLLVPGFGALIIDRVDLRFAGLVESRIHTTARVKAGRTSAELIGHRGRMRAAWASDVPGELFRSQVTSTRPGDEPETLRWFVNKTMQLSVTIATLLSPGRPAASVELDTGGRQIHVIACRGDKRKTITLSPQLRAAGRKRK